MFSFDILCCVIPPKRRSPSVVGEDKVELEPEKNLEKSSKRVSPKKFNLYPLSDQLKHYKCFSPRMTCQALRAPQASNWKNRKRSNSPQRRWNTLKSEASSSIQNLSAVVSRAQASSLSNLLPMNTTETVKNIVHLPDHERKVLKRMSMKNL